MDRKGVAESLETVAAQAVELARRLGADQAEAGASYDEGLVGHRAHGRARVRRAATRSRLGRHRLSRSEERQREHDGLLGEQPRGHGAQGAQHRQLHGGRRVRGPRRCQPHGRRSARARPVLPVGRSTSTTRPSSPCARENAARALDARIANSEGATVSTRRGPSRVRELARLRRRLSDQHVTRRAAASSRSRTSSLERDYWYSVSRSPDELESPESVGEEAARRALQRLDARQLSTRVVPVIFPAELAQGAVRPSRRGDPRHGSVPARVVPARRRRQASAAELRRHHRGPADPARARERTVRRRRRRDEAPRARHRRRAAGATSLSSYSARRLGMPTTGNAGGVHNLHRASRRRARSRT